MQPGELGSCQVIKEVPKIQMEYRERTRHVVDDFGSPWLRFVELRLENPWFVGNQKTFCVNLSEAHSSPQSPNMSNS